MTILTLRVTTYAGLAFAGLVVLALMLGIVMPGGGMLAFSFVALLGLSLFTRRTARVMP